MRTLFLIALATILVSLPIHSSVVTVANGEIYCDGVTCPAGSTSCTVTKNTFGDLKEYKYIRLCADASKYPTLTVEETLTNPNPGRVIDSVSSYGDVLSEEEQRKLDARIGEIVEETQNHWKKWSSDLVKNLQNSFPPGFPFNRK